MTVASHIIVILAYAIELLPSEKYWFRIYGRVFCESSLLYILRPPPSLALDFRVWVGLEGLGRLSLRVKIFSDFCEFFCRVLKEGVGGIWCRWVFRYI